MTMEKPPVNPGTVRHVILDTEGVCFLCLRTKTGLEESDSGHDNLVLLGSFSRYLKLDYGRYFPPYEEENENILPDVDAMLICEESNGLSSLFTDLFSALELARLELNECVLNILGVMSSAQEDTDSVKEAKKKIECELTANIFQEMRLEAIQKCNEKITAVPRVRLQKLLERNRGRTPEGAPSSLSFGANDFNQFEDVQLPPSCLVEVEPDPEDVLGSGSPDYFSYFPDHMDYDDTSPGSPHSPPPTQTPLPSPKSAFKSEPEARITSRTRSRDRPRRKRNVSPVMTSNNLEVEDSGEDLEKPKRKLRERPRKGKPHPDPDPIPAFKIEDLQDDDQDPIEEFSSEGESPSNSSYNSEEEPSRKRKKKPNPKSKQSLDSNSLSGGTGKSGQAESTPCKYCRWTPPAGGTIRSTTKWKMKNHLVAHHTEHFFSKLKAPGQVLTLNQFRMLIKHHLFDNFSRKESKEKKNKNSEVSTSSKKLIQCIQCPQTFSNNGQVSFTLHCIKRHFPLLVDKLNDLQKNSKLLPDLTTSSLEKGKECDHCQEFHSSKELCKLHEKHFCLQNEDWVPYEKHKRLATMNIVSQSEGQLEGEISTETIKEFQDQKQACAYCNCVFTMDINQSTLYNLHVARFHPEEYFQSYMESTILDKLQFQIFMRDVLFHDLIKEPEDKEDIGCYSCPSCSREFRGSGSIKDRSEYRAQLLDHLLREHGDIIQEKISSLQSNSKDILEKVKQRCELGTKCKYCGGWYSTKIGCSVHERKYCTQNPETFLRRKKIMLFFIRRKFQCLDCLKFFKNERSLWHHIGGGYCHPLENPKKENGQGQQTVNCSVCGEACVKGTWVTHRLNECVKRVKDYSSSSRSVQQRKIECEDCGKVLSRWQLAKHQQNACEARLGTGGKVKKTRKREKRAITPKTKTETTETVEKKARKKPPKDEVGTSESNLKKGTSYKNSRTICEDCGNPMHTRFLQRHKKRSCSEVPGRLARARKRSLMPGYVYRGPRTTCQDCGMFSKLLRRHVENSCHGLFGKDRSKNKTPIHIPGGGRGPGKMPRNYIAPGPSRFRGKDRKPRKRKISKKSQNETSEESLEAPETPEQVHSNKEEIQSFQGQLNQNHNQNLNPLCVGFMEGMQMEGMGIKDEEIYGDGSQHSFQSSARPSSQPQHYQEPSTAHWSQLKFGTF